VVDSASPRMEGQLKNTAKSWEGVGWRGLGVSQPSDSYLFSSPEGATLSLTNSTITRGPDNGVPVSFFPNQPNQQLPFVVDDLQISYFENPYNHT
jgi:hypothetical protein